jgi:hypothetical protein
LFSGLFTGAAVMNLSWRVTAIGGGGSMETAETIQEGEVRIQEEIGLELIDAVRALEQQLWMVRVQRAL